MRGILSQRSRSDEKCFFGVAFGGSRAAFAGTRFHPGGGDHAHVEAGRAGVALDGLQAGLNRLKARGVGRVHHHVSGVAVQRGRDLRER